MTHFFLLAYLWFMTVVWFLGAASSIREKDAHGAIAMGVHLALPLALIFAGV